MTTITQNVIRQELRESSRVTAQSQEATRVLAKNRQTSEDVLTLPEIKLHLDDILKETQIKYTLNENDSGFIIKVMDKKTDEVIKEIPSHDIQVLRKHFRTHIGVLFNELI